MKIRKESKWKKISVVEDDGSVSAIFNLNEIGQLTSKFPKSRPRNLELLIEQLDLILHKETGNSTDNQQNLDVNKDDERIGKAIISCLEQLSESSDSSKRKHSSKSSNQSLDEWNDEFFYKNLEEDCVNDLEMPFFDDTTLTFLEDDSNILTII